MIIKGLNTLICLFSKSRATLEELRKIGLNPQTGIAKTGVVALLKGGKPCGKNLEVQPPSSQDNFLWVFGLKISFKPWLKNLKSMLLLAYQILFWKRIFRQFIRLYMFFNFI